MKSNDSFEFFKECVKNWVDFFGLYNWEVGVHSEEGNGDGSLAYTTFHVENKRADIFLCEDWDGLEKTDRELDKTAFHEVCEVLLLRIRYLAGKREFSYDELDGEIHSIIRILTAKIFEKSK